jgi:hypothetical protein
MYLQDRDMPSIWESLAIDGPTVDDWISNLGPDPDEIRAVGPIATMRGEFHDGPRGSHAYEWTFEPNSTGSETAVVLPVKERGKFVDIVAFDSVAYSEKWGCVSGLGTFLNHNAIAANKATPLRVHSRWWSWFYFACEGVLPLAHSALPELREAGDILAEDDSHARQLLYNVFVFPLGLESKAEGQQRIFVDEDDSELIARTVARFTCDPAKLSPCVT